MLITRLKLDYFGKFSGREIELKPGINIIYGENEAGKSTLHAFIKGMLFGIERLKGRGAASKEDIYTRYLPWDYPGAYGGQMDIRVGEKSYRLQRSFHANDRYFTITDMETGREVKLKEGHIDELIPGLNEAAFRNTISMEQLKVRTDAELAAQVRNYIANLSVAKSREINVERAIELLKQKKKALESASYKEKIKELENKIEEETEDVKKIDKLTSTLKDLDTEKKKLIARLETLKSSGNQKEARLMDELPAVMERYRSFIEKQKEYINLRQQIGKLKEKLATCEKEAADGADLNNDLGKARELDIQVLRLRDSIQNLGNELEGKKRKSKAAGVLYIVISAVISFACYIITKSAPLGILSLLTLLVISGIVYIANKKRIKSCYDVRIKDAKENYRKAENEIKQIFGKYKVTSLTELAEKQEGYVMVTVSMEHDRKLLAELNERMKSLEDDCDELHDAIMLYMRNFISAEELTPQAMEKLQDVIYEKKKEAESSYNRLKSELEAVNIQIERTNWELSLLEDSETRLLNNKARYEDLIIKQQENEKEISAIELASDTIRELAAAIHDSFGKELNRAVSGIISEVTNGKYQDIKVDENLNIKLVWNDKYIVLDKLSAGTIDQVYFALRLAVADLFFGNNSMPLLLDDSFALYDDIRVKSALMRIADRKQVIIFSCQIREKNILEEMGLPFNFIKL